MSTCPENGKGGILISWYFHYLGRQLLQSQRCLLLLLCVCALTRVNSRGTITPQDLDIYVELRVLKEGALFVTISGCVYIINKASYTLNIPLVHIASICSFLILLSHYHRGESGAIIGHLCQTEQHEMMMMTN